MFLYLLIKLIIIYLYRLKRSKFSLYNLIVQDIGNNFSSNRNGIFVNMNLLSDNCIGEINNYLSNKYDENPIKSEYVFEDYSSKKTTKKNIKLNYH